MWLGSAVTRIMRVLRVDQPGLVVGTVFYTWSLTPSLLPRNWAFQGLIGGITAAIGYGFGALLALIAQRWLLPNVSWWPPPIRLRRIIRIGVPLLCLALWLVTLHFAVGWQGELAALMGTEAPSYLGYLRAPVISAALAVAIIGTFRILRDLVGYLARALNRFFRIPKRVAGVVSLLLMLIAVYTVIDGIAIRGSYAAMNAIFSVENDQTRDGAVQPTLPEKSGSPESLARWDTLGFEGRNFVSGGIHADRLAEFNGRPAKEPIRVYAGLESADGVDAQMTLLVDELERTGAFDRSTLVIIPTTGTGWVNPTAAQTFELVANGDSALVAAQYSYLPSWVSFLADREKAADAGRRLVDAVHRRWLTKPEGHRPKLFVYGESLGTQAGEGAFNDLNDIRSTVDGVLWVGPPNSNRLWNALVQRRDPGTPEAEPTYANGLVVRFANDAAGIKRNPDEWMSPRVLYIQHRSDPVVWWSPDLLFSKPGWLSEPAGADRAPAVRWYPIVTFWQVSADLGNAAGVPDGHGHNYGTVILDGWIAVTQPAGWTDADTARVRQALEALRGHDGPEK
ncbi:alpha/beta hydrolase [Gordonia hydrophobica]|uniref:Alpha/beta hydrolase n=1 Tax=Gordonia hydrophobica TaxID=40516 RepID=A0ABZ2U3J7_9ACTN|nr:alpha/beta hydrolase [Gordonia hydrophobica]MBM7367873.1 putative membrane protein [Gordonia hydrophobica]